MKVIIIGGVAAGMSAASKLKRLKEDTEIIVYEKGSDLSYGACGMPYFISDVIKEEASLIARTKDEFLKRGINVYTQHEVIKVDTDQKQLSIKDLENNTIIYDTYDKLIIATGASAIRLPVEGKTLKGIHTLKTLEDARSLKQRLQDETVQKIAVIGGGFIGLEVVESIVESGKKAILIEREPQLMPQYDADIMAPITTMLARAGVEIHLGETVKAYQGDETVSRIKTDKRTLSVDLVIEAIGVKPDTGFLEDSDIKRHDNGAVIVDKQLRTNLEDIYAAGDCATVYHRLKDSFTAYVPLGTHANKAGRIIAENIAGNPITFPGVIGSNHLKCLQYEIAKTGLSEKEAEALDLAFDTVMVKAANQAGYYPDAKPVHIKLTFERHTHRLLGCQMVGEKGVALRINIMATAIQAGMDAQTFSNLDLAYAPPFSPVWDPLQVATNQIK